MIPKYLILMSTTCIETQERTSQLLSEALSSFRICLIINTYLSRYHRFSSLQCQRFLRSPLHGSAAVHLSVMPLLTSAPSLRYLVLSTGPPNPPV